MFSLLDAPGWITGHLMSVHIRKKILYHYRAANVYNYTAVYSTPNRPNYTVGHNTLYKLELYEYYAFFTNIYY